MKLLKLLSRLLWLAIWGFGGDYIIRRSTTIFDILAVSLLIFVFAVFGWILLSDGEDNY